jgi:hypothetical protein
MSKVGLGIGGIKGERKVTKKCIVKVVMSKEQREILSELARRLGTSESEMLRTAFMDYAKELSMVKERLHRDKGLVAAL